MPCEYLTVDVSDLTGVVRHNISKDILKWRLNARQAVLGDSMAVAVKEAKAEDASRHTRTTTSSSTTRTHPSRSAQHVHVVRARREGAASA